MSTPIYTETIIDTPEVTEPNLKTMTPTENDMPLPQVTEKIIQQPKFGHPENCVTVNGHTIEIKATKLKYQRDRTAAFYRVLQTMPIVDILALEPHILDEERDPDKMLFDWLIAVTDDPEFVQENYDCFDSDAIEKMLLLFCKLNHIDEREERKNRAAQVRNP